ncbi:MAG: GNAT family N-acetyltransferase [Luteolibacter sp.]
MKIHVLTQPAPPALGLALEEFESQFAYPLGPRRSFRISHGLEYLPFFQAIGEASVLVAERDGKVVGTLAFVRRPLELTSSGMGTERRSAHYLCDLKVAPSARGSIVLSRLLQEAKARIEPGESHACYCVVMDGTGRLPVGYTGRVGVPVFEKIGSITVLRLSAGQESSFRSCSMEELSKVRTRIAHGGCTATGGMSRFRSLMEPLSLVEEAGAACGILEDTRLAKRLFPVDGGELLSAHLSGFAYTTPAAGGRLLRSAVAAALENGLPAVFVAVPSGEVARLLPELEGIEVLQAPASVYGYDLPAGLDWWVDTAEI